ncbi:MAG: hypothetical protein MUC71_13700 [Steroidobacteraceae bacterium]|jgi:hypothetical protein|nr:hypothetical protein [Steroidobacteraceae bacterium]
MTGRRALATAALGALLLHHAAVAAEGGQEPPDDAPAAAPTEAAAGLPAEAAPVAVPAQLRRDPCHPPDASSNALDSVRAGLHRQVCASARWFDGLFGDPREHEDAYGESYGRLGMALAWDELDDAEVDLRMRASLELPQLSQRFNAVIGREDPETFVKDSYDVIAYLPGSFSDDTNAQWYAGLNYLARGDSRSVVDYGAGIRLSTPLNPYVRARYRYYHPLGERVLLIPRATAFWENKDGFGATLAADADWSIDDELLLRWANTFTFSEATEGVRWRSRLTLYQALDAKSAMRYELSIQGETDGLEPDYKGLRVTHRRSVWRDWFFLEFGTSLFWADDEDPRERCEACLGATVGFELLFGKRYDRSLKDFGNPE